MNVIACRQTKVGQAVADVAGELHVPFTICEGNCPHDHARVSDGILFLTNGNPVRIGAETMEEIAEFEKPALVVAARCGQDVEFVRNWIQRKRIGNLHITGNASHKASRRFVQAVLGADPPPRRPAGLLARIIRRGWRCRTLELE